MRRNSRRFLNESDNQAKVRKAAKEIADYLSREYPGQEREIMTDIIQFSLEEAVCRRSTLHSEVGDKIYDKYHDSRLEMMANDFKNVLDQSIQWDMIDLRDKYFK